MRLYDEDANFSRDIEWTLEYNDLNQLTIRFVGASWSVGTHRIEYDYDANGNLIGSVEETYSGVWSVSEEWVYDWNPRDQMTRAMKWAGSSGSTNNVGSVEYQYCLACDGALSKRFVYAGGSGASRGALQSGQRYEYDGLNLLRVDEIYGSILSESGPWRTLEISTHQPGQLGALLHKRVYEYSSATSGTPSQTKDFTYSYDPVGNVYSVFDANGNEAYYFTQDAFGNELPITTLGGDDWDAARADCIVEHQTGKWIDEFTGLYYFWARWYDSGVGRFVGRDPVTIGGHILRTLISCNACAGRSPSKNNLKYSPTHPYEFCNNNSNQFVDPTGRVCVDFTQAEAGFGPILWSVGGFVLEFTSSHPCRETRRTCQFFGITLGVGPSTPLDAWIATGTCCNLDTCCIDADDVGSRIGGELGGHLATPFGAGNVNLFSIGEGWDCYVNAMDGGFRGVGAGIEAEVSITLITLGCRK